MRQLLIDGGAPVNESALEEDVKEIIEFETKIASLQTAEEGRHNLMELYNPSTISELRRLIPVVRLCPVFHGQLLVRLRSLLRRYNPHCCKTVFDT